MKGVKKLLVAPAIEVPLLCFIRALRASTYTHLQSRSLFLVRERVWAISEHKWACVCQLEQTCEHTHTHTHTHKPLMYADKPFGKKVQLSCKKQEKRNKVGD